MSTPHEQMLANQDRKWYELNAAQWVTVATVIAGAILSFGLFQNKLSNTSDSVKELQSRVIQIDAIGTRASSMALQRDNQMISSMDQRLQKLEDVNTQIKLVAQTLEVLKTDIAEVKGDLKEVKERPSNYAQPRP